jgi:hypothetical protein
MVVERPARQVNDLFAKSADGGRAGFIVEAQQLVRVGDVEIVTDQGHAKRRVEVGDEYRASFRHAITVLVAQQRDPVGAGHACARPTHDFFHDETTDALAVLRFGRRVGFGHQHIAVGEHVQPARMVKAFGERCHLSARGCLWPAALGPTHCGGDVDSRDQGLIGLGQLG